MSESLKLDAFQRLQLEGLLNQQRGTVTNLMVTYEIIEKIRLPKEQAETHTKATPDGRVMIDRKGLATIPEESFEMEKAEKRKLLEILNGNEGFGPGDIEWVMPIRKQLTD